MRIALFVASCLAVATVRVTLLPRPKSVVALRPPTMAVNRPTYRPVCHWRPRVKTSALWIYLLREWAGF